MKEDPEYRGSYFEYSVSIILTPLITPTAWEEKNHRRLSSFLSSSDSRIFKARSSYWRPPHPQKTQRIWYLSSAVLKQCLSVHQTPMKHLNTDLVHPVYPNHRDVYHLLIKNTAHDQLVSCTFTTPPPHPIHHSSLVLSSTGKLVEPFSLFTLFITELC